MSNLIQVFIEKKTDSNPDLDSGKADPDWTADSDRVANTDSDGTDETDQDGTADRDSDKTDETDPDGTYTGGVADTNSGSTTDSVVTVTEQKQIQ